MPPLKDLSETLRNLVIAVSFAMTGGWVLYKWDTVFPKTEAEVATAAASVEADISGQLDVWLADPPAGLSLDNVCSAPAVQEAFVEIPLYGHLKVASAASIPVLVRLSTLDISRYSPGIAAVAAGPVEAGFAAVPRRGRWDEVPYDSILGSPARSIDGGQSDTIAFVLRGRFGFDCTELPRDTAAPPIFAVTAVARVDKFDRVAAATIPESDVEVGFTDICWVAVDGTSDCGFEGYPAPPG